jgi:hypothetical protein
MAYWRHLFRLFLVHQIFLQRKIEKKLSNFYKETGIFTMVPQHKATVLSFLSSKEDFSLGKAFRLPNTSKVGLAV